jgi:hypothetical protein
MAGSSAGGGCLTRTNDAMVVNAALDYRPHTPRAGDGDGADHPAGQVHTLRNHNVTRPCLSDFRQ